MHGAAMNGDAALVAVLRRTKASSGKVAAASLEDAGSRRPLGLHAGLGHYLSHSDPTRPVPELAVAPASTVTGVGHVNDKNGLDITRLAPSAQLSNATP